MGIGSEGCHPRLMSGTPSGVRWGLGGRKRNDAKAAKAERINPSVDPTGFTDRPVLPSRQESSAQSQSGRGLCSLHGFGVDDQTAAAVLSPHCGRARWTSQVQLLAPRLKGQLIYDPEPGPFRWA
jgi:hypothetical protein